MTARSVQTVHAAPLDHPAEGFRTRNFGPTNLGAAMDPFVNLDEFVMTRPVFRAHPHAGFSAITYMFEDSEGTFVNRWSMGGDELIGPGAVHWTQAGSGMFHEEVPVETGPPCHGLQMFVKLPAALELSAPQAFHMDADEVPEVIGDGVRVRVLAGSHAGVASPMAIANDLDWLDVHVDAGATFVAPAPADRSAFLVVVTGAIEVAGARVEAHSGAVLGPDGDTIELHAVGEAEVLVCSGPPLREPFVSSGPFMMSTEQRLHDAFGRMRSGDMGRLDPSF
jgi:redox-sensitive bicupin YhaK (pirin superfamily)